MIRLKTFGNIELRGAGGELRGILTQPKRLALLLRLAADRPGSYVRRDTLLAMFWPELDTAGARNALRQALFHLRRELGEGVLVNRGNEEIGLDPSAIRSDIGEFEQAADAGRWDVALDLLAGDFAPGLNVPDAAGFEEWIDAVRVGIRSRAAAGAWALSRDAESRADLAGAAAWARRAVQQVPEDEAGVRRLMRLLIEAGDPAGAAQAYGSFEERMRREYDVAPAAETQALRRSVATAVPPEPSIAVPPAVGVVAPRVRRRRSWALLAAAALALLAVAARWRFREESTPPLSDARLLVAPFRAAPQDTLLQALSVGLVELLNARLSGASVPRPVDPDVALRVVAAEVARDSAPEAQALLRAARRTGAGFILTGSLVRDGERLALAPLAIETRTGHARPLPPLGGPVDSLPSMVDRMAVSLLSTIAGEDPADTPALATIPLPALRAYLDGRQAMREGRVVDAIAALGRALELDTTFALAAREQAEALDWVGEDAAATAKGRAWRLRNRLGARDRAILIAQVGRRWPALTPIPEQVADWEEAIRWAPDRSRAWFGLGDVLFHAGMVAGIPDAGSRARHAFDRSLALDSSAVPVRLHRVELAAREGDTATVRRLLPRAGGTWPSGDAIEFIRWRAAVALGDSAALRGRAGELDSLQNFALLRIAGWAQLDGLGMAAPVRASEILRTRTGTSAEARMAMAIGFAVAGNRGRFGELDSLLRGYGQELTPTILVWFAGEEAARSRVRELERAIRGGADTTLHARNEVLQWHLWTGDSVPVAEARRLLAETRLRPGELQGMALGCLAAVRLGEPDAAAYLRRADSLLRQLPGADLVGTNPLLLARCHEVAGDRQGALAMLARRPLDPMYGPRYLTGYLFEEGRLSALEGDRPRALRAWRHFLTLRDDPDPSLRPQLAAVRRLVDSLARN